MSAVVKDLARAVAAGAGPSVRLIRGDTVILEPTRWLWPGYLPAGMLTILGGAPGCGKTTIALSLGATVTSGGIWPGGMSRSTIGDVVVWSGEDAHPVLAARLEAMGADMRRVHFIDGISSSEGEAFDPGRDMLLLEATAERLEAPRLLILDPIVSAVAGDSHKGAEAPRSLQPVVALVQRLGCAVLGITHFSKGTGGRDPVERVTGSIAFAALARLVLVAAKVQADEGEAPRRVLVRAKSNIGPDDGGFAYSLDRVEVAPEIEGQRVVWLEALQGSAREVLAEAEANPGADEETSALDDAVQFLRSELRDGPRPAKAIFREARGDQAREGRAEGRVDQGEGGLGVGAARCRVPRGPRVPSGPTMPRVKSLAPLMETARVPPVHHLETLAPLALLAPLASLAVGSTRGARLATPMPSGGASKVRRLQALTKIQGSVFARTSRYITATWTAGAASKAQRVEALQLQPVDSEHIFWWPGALPKEVRKGPPALDFR